MQCIVGGVGWGSANTATHIVALICLGKAYIILLCKLCILLMHGIVEGGGEGGGGNGHLFWIVLLVKVGLSELCEALVL